MCSGPDFYDADALLERLTNGVARSERPIVLLLGSAVTAPHGSSEQGVPSVAGIVEMIKAEFDTSQLERLDDLIRSSENVYQDAFSFLVSRRGQEAANDVVKKAVWKARRIIAGTGVEFAYRPSSTTPDDICLTLDHDVDGWILSEAVAAVGMLATEYSARFGSTILTTNFDPLIEVAITRAGGQSFRTVLQGDGNLAQTTASGCHVIHLHGYWHGSDTLHTPTQLTYPRPRLRASLTTLLEGSTLVVCGYGGWDDAITNVLAQLVQDDSAFPEVIWNTPDRNSLRPALLERLSPGLARGRVSIYSGVDCHAFLPELLQRWREREAPSPLVAHPKSRGFVPGLVPPASAVSSAREYEAHFYDEEASDRPPHIDICVGRDKELEFLENASNSVFFITGIGGQGKSTIAAKYYDACRSNRSFERLIWRDCKEESARFEIQIASVVSSLLGGQISLQELTSKPIDVLAQLFVNEVIDRKFLIVFDNVDHYVDLQGGVLSGPAGSFLEIFLRSPNNCRLIFTCRPTIQHEGDDVVTLRVGGLDVQAAVELFARRGAAAPRVEVETAHGATGGHAFWLDLLAAQIAKPNSQKTLAAMLHEIGAGSSHLPTAMLHSIWQTLVDRERTVLRSMAETVRPESDIQIAEYLRSQLNFNQVSRALRSLKNLNLIVVKRRLGVPDVLELHPLVREFVRTTFQRQERITFIDWIIAGYDGLIRIYRQRLNQRPPFSVLEHWTQQAELQIEADRLDRAFGILAEVCHPLVSGGHPGEFARVCRLLFVRFDWKRYAEYEHFDLIVVEFCEVLIRFGLPEEYEELLENYKTTISTADIRYISYCYIQCQKYWMTGLYGEAIRWGEKGERLKKKNSEVDTQYSTSNTLALARRDAGIVDPALKYFLLGRELSVVIDPTELDDTYEHSHYGNVGRCLHLIGQIDSALICYRKSAILLDKIEKYSHLENEGFARKWIGELLFEKGDACLAESFFFSAKRRWMLVCPSRVPSIDLLIENARPFACHPLNVAEQERACTQWIYGNRTPSAKA